MASCYVLDSYRYGPLCFLHGKKSDVVGRAAALCEKVDGYTFRVIAYDLGGKRPRSRVVCTFSKEGGAVGEPVTAVPGGSSRWVPVPAEEPDALFADWFDDLLLRAKRRQMERALAPGT